MPLQNFMAADVVAILEGCCLFFLLMVPPGYALGWITGVFQFRKRTLPFRMVSSVPLSIAIGPIFCYTVGRWVSLDAVLAGYLCIGLFSLLLAKRFRWAAVRLSFHRFRMAFGLSAAWLAIAVCSLADMQIGRRLYFSITAFDYAVRTAFTQAVSAGGIPAQNPFFFPGHAVGLRYHYFWIALCGAVHRLGHGLIDARQAFIAGTIWCGLGLICLIPLFLRVFFGISGRALERRSVICIALLGVTGLDLLPALLMVRWQAIGWVQGIPPSVEWWNNQVDGWLYTMLWEPHYLCAVIACFTGFLVLWSVEEATSWPARLFAITLAGCAFASAAGSGIYVAFVFAVFLGVWLIITLIKKWFREAITLLAAGSVALALCAPYLLSMRSISGTNQASVLQLTIRSFDLGEFIFMGFGFQRSWQLMLGNALLLPVNYFLEFGFYFAAALLYWLRFRKENRAATRQELAAFTLATVSCVICTFLKSGVITNNDLGWRGFLIAQFVLLLWGGQVLFEQFQRGRVFLTALVFIGGAGVVYDLAILRFYPVLSDSGQVPKIGWLANDRQLGLRTYANREAYEWLRAHTSATAIIQQNPEPIYQDTFFGLYGQRQTLVEDVTCGTAFGGSLTECQPMVLALSKLYLANGSETLESVCRVFPVDVLVAKDTDGAWQNSGSWVSKGHPLFANNFVRLFACGEANSPPIASTVPSNPDFPATNLPLNTSGVYSGH